MLTILSLVGTVLSLGWHVYNSWKTRQSSPAIIANKAAVQEQVIEDQMTKDVNSGNLETIRKDASAGQ